MTEEKKTIEISNQLYESINQLKQIFTQITWQNIQSDEEVLSIIVWWFIESITQDNSLVDQNQHIITDSHDCKCWWNCKH